MLFKLKKVKKNGFTMLELILVCTVFALLVSGIILAINRTYVFMNNAKVQIRATNLTREGMEMMFNIRDTNRRKCSGEKDRFWLYLGSGSNDEERCLTNNGSIDYIFQKGIYTIKEGRKNGSGDKFIYAEPLTDIDTDEEIEEFYELEGFFKDDATYNKARSGAIVSFTGTYTYWSGSVKDGTGIIGEISDLLGEGVIFYRIARIYGIYDKNAEPDDQVEDTNLHNSDPKEMRFCVKTFYKMGVGHHSSELCSIMTNFME